MLADQKDKPAFKLRDGSFRGNGLTPEFQNVTWEQFRDAIYPIKPLYDNDDK